MYDDIQIETSDDDPDEVMALRLHRKLAETNGKRKFIDDTKRFAVTAKGPGGDLMGGAAGLTKWQWMYVESLWIAEEMRGLKLGAQLLRQAETLARDRGCIGVWLDTMSFEAKPFYLKQGYKEFGAIHDLPPGHQRHFLCKRLD